MLGWRLPVASRFAARVSRVPATAGGLTTLKSRLERQAGIRRTVLHAGPVPAVRIVT